MKIKETIERECCDINNDLKPYVALCSKSLKGKNPRFCKHCGQIWVNEKQKTPAGDSETVNMRLEIRA